MDLYRGREEIKEKKVVYYSLNPQKRSIKARNTSPLPPILQLLSTHPQSHGTDIRQTGTPLRWREEEEEEEEEGGKRRGGYKNKKERS